MDAQPEASDHLRQFQARLEQLASKASTGDAQALAQLRVLLDENQKLVRHFGDLSSYVEAAWLASLAGQNALMREAVKRQLDQLKADIAGPHPTAIEKLLADQVAVNYLADRNAEYLEAATSGGTPQLAALRFKRSESTQRRLLASIRMLTTLRALVPGGLTPPGSIGLHNAQQESA